MSKTGQRDSLPFGFTHFGKGECQVALSTPPMLPGDKSGYSAQPHSDPF
jgi:hypothetical protein